jgi:light-regulated signal transduction histidine kinase (bacteriophytochrome)
VTNERYTFKSIDGRETAILASSAPFWVKDRLAGAAVVFRDVTEWEKAQAALQEYAQRLEGANRELRDFAFIASHDLQEPVRKIRAFSERLQTRYASTIDEDGLDLLKRMNGAAERMQRMISDLLQLSRVTTQGQPFIPVDLNQVVTEVISDLEVRLEQTGGQVISNKLPAIQADPQQMTQLFLNLVGNALKFHQPGLPPLVRISGRLLPNIGRTGRRKVEIRVEDNGIGFNPQNVERIFQPFQRLHSQSEYEGTGIGLSICQKIVERHGGSIRAESEAGRGSTFIITLPG